MRLVKLKIKNFRCYKHETELQIDDLSAIIGKNDSGKSSLLDALDAFFNDKIDAGDLSTDADDRTIEITCSFAEVPELMVLDAAEPTSPQAEGVLNEFGQLEVTRAITFGARKSVSVYLRAFHPSDVRLMGLLSLKNAELKGLARELGVDLKGIDTRKNPPIRQRIREAIGGAREVMSLKVDGQVGTDDNIRKVWAPLRSHLPIFSIFKSDKTFDDKDGDVKNPLHEAIKEALALEEIQQKLQEVQDKVREFSTDVADRTIEKLKLIDASISENLKSEFTKDPSFDKVFDITLLNERNIPLNKRGSGIRRLVILSFFQAQAEKRKAEVQAPAIIYAIEEPETSQHPNHQKMIINALVELSEQSGIQVLFTTHSANLVKEIPSASLRYVCDSEDGKITIKYGTNRDTGMENSTVVDDIIQALGILPNPADQVRAIVFVEGNNDVQALQRYSKILHQHDAHFMDLARSEEVAYVITGGSALKHYIEKRYLEGLGKPQVHIYDGDIAEYVQKVAQINAENNPKKVGFNTQKRELENYLHHEAIVEAYTETGMAPFVMSPIEDHDDVPLKVAQAIYESGGEDWNALSEDQRKEKSDRKKKFLNSMAVEKMTYERLSNRGGVAEVSGWLLKIAQAMNA